MPQADRAVRAAERFGLRPENRRYQLSRLSATVFLALFLTGIAEGAAQHTRRRQ